jgi:alanyl-tRNA synthetase
VVREEEEQFLTQLEDGLRYLHDTFRKTRAAGSDTIAGPDAFNLHQTYGIPVEITESLAAEHNLRIDMPGFEAARKHHSQISRGTAEAAAVFVTGPLDTLKESYHHGSEFLGYATTVAEARVIGILAQNQLVDSESASPPGAPPVALVLDRTPFYGESGGQVGDTGKIVGEGFVFEVMDTKKDNDFTLHIGRVAKGTAHLNDEARAEVDAPRRAAIRRAHSATHVLHHALHMHLGKHAQQAGSKVEADRLRFDFANPAAVGRERLRLIEDTVNDHILRSEAVSWTHMPLAEAKAQGAMALFGEKYPEIVRVVQMGSFSRELCGGTHLDNTAQIGLFKILGEESVAAGTRRITALTGSEALAYVRQGEDALFEAATALKVAPALVAQRAGALVEELKTLKKQASHRPASAAPKVSADDLLASAAQFGPVRVVAQALSSMAPDELRQLIDALRKKASSGLAVLLASATDGKVHLAAGLTPDLVERGFHAGIWLKDVAPVVGGGGGGRPDLAQAGGKNPDQIPAAIERALVVMRAKVEQTA